MTIHGGDVWQVQEEFGIPSADLLDFSANINPRGLPLAAQQRLVSDAGNLRLLGSYPDPSAAALRCALGQKLDIDADAIVIGPGAEALLSPILRAFAPRRALIPVPAFSEYRRMCDAEKIPVVSFPLRRSDLFRVPVDHFRASITPGDVVFLNSPHNPSGALLHRAEIERIHETVVSQNATLLLDEAFIDYAPDASLAYEAATQSGIVVLRSLTKFYGCPALRVGYAVANPQTVRKIRSLLPAWPVTQLALDAVVEAVGDCEYAEASLRENAAERERLASELSTLGFFVFPSVANYLFLELPLEFPPALELRRWLIANHRILIRNCDSYEGLAHGRYVRVAVRTAQENARLIEALAARISGVGR